MRSETLSTTLPFTATTWQYVASVPGCDARGRAAGDLERILSVVTALQYRINSAKQLDNEDVSSNMTESHSNKNRDKSSARSEICAVPVYMSAVSAGTLMSVAVIPHIQVSSTCDVCVPMLF